MAEGKVEYYRDKKGEWRWRRWSSNGRITGASSEGYSGRKDCEANATRDGAKDRWEFYSDKRGEHRWRSKASNGRQVGKSSEGFSSKKACQSNARMNGWNG